MNTSEQLKSLRRSPERNSGGRRMGPILVLLAFVVGIGLLFILLFGERLRPRITVSTAPALLLETEGDAQTPAVEPGAMITQASGWIEPDPYPIHVPVKTDGFVDTVHVLEGQAVYAGDLLAMLDPTNQMLEVARFEAMLKETEASLAAQQESIRKSQAMSASAEARKNEAVDRADRIRALSDDDVSPVERIAADRTATEASSAYDAANADTASQTITAQKLEAAVERIKAELKQAKVNLERTRVIAPVDGIVLKRYAEPGQKRMAGMDDMDSAKIVSLYDPKKLQVRVDVPLSAVGLIETGMPARIVTAAFPNRTFDGVVSRITGEADITRNTLQVKVAILEPDPRMRPEMLCRAEFLGHSSATPRTGSAGNRMLWIPAGAVISGENGTAQAWVVNPVDNTAELRAITLGTALQDDLQSVIDGLRAGERVVTAGAENLKPGALVTPAKGEKR